MRDSKSDFDEVKVGIKIIYAKNAERKKRHNNNKTRKRKKDGKSSKQVMMLWQ